MTGIGTTKGLTELHQEKLQDPIEATKGTVTIDTSDTNQGGTNTIFVTGELLQATWTTANMEDADATLLELKDEDGVVAFSSGTQAESTQFSFAQGGTNIGGGGGTLNLDKVWLWGTTKVIMTAEGTQSADRNVAYTILTKR